MTTLRYKLLETTLRLTHADRMIRKVMDGKPFKSAKLPGRLKSRAERVEIAGQTVWIIHPKSGPAKTAYIHFHGGAYILGLMALHFGLAAQLSERAGVSVVLPDYPLAPKSEVEEITVFANDVFELAKDRWGHVKIGGGSAGGNLAMALALHRKNKTLRVSPTFADLSGLAPISIFTGDVDLLHTDILAFAEKAKAAGGLSLPEYNGCDGTRLWMLARWRDLPCAELPSDPA